jgi:hypothetical protein
MNESVKEVAQFLSGHFKNNGTLAKQVRGAITDSINVHGPITKDNMGSAQRRITCSIRAYIVGILKQKYGG